MTTKTTHRGSLPATHEQLVKLACVRGRLVEAGDYDAIIGAYRRAMVPQGCDARLSSERAAVLIELLSSDRVAA